MVERVKGPKLEGNLFIYMYHEPVKGRNILKTTKKIHKNAVC
jgi:hypothetical protein